MTLSSRLMIAMVALVLLTATAIGALTYRNVLSIALPRGLDRIDTHARVIATVLEASVRAARADVIGFHAATAIETMAAHPTDSAIGAEMRTRLALRFVAELTAKPDYAQFRVIGVAGGGRELVRVDRSGPAAAIRVVPDNELQRKDDRDYFKAAIALPPDGIYVSRIDLNQEKGAFQIPYVPTLRTAAPIYTPDGTPFGIVIINVDLRPAFTRIRSELIDGTTLYVVNEVGDYLLHPDPSRQFGFEFGRPQRVQDDFPEFAGLLAKDDTPPQVMSDRTGARFGIGWDSVRLAGGPKVSVIETMPYAQVIAAATSIRDSSLIGGLVAVLCAVALAVGLTRSLTRPLVQMTKAVKRFSGDGRLTMPTGGGAEINSLADAFTQMAAELQAKTAALDSALNNMHHGLLMFDRDNRAVVINRTYIEMYGLSPEKAKPGRTMRELLEQRVANGTFGGDVDDYVKNRIIDKVFENPDGRSIRVVNRMMNDGGWVSTHEDVTRQRQDEAAIRAYAEREQLFIAAVESSNDAIVTKSLDGVITGWNQAAERLFGYTAQEAIGKRIDIIVPDELRSEVRRILAKIKSDEKVDHHETARINKNGQRIDVSLSVSPVKSQSGAIIGAAKVARDITARKKAHQALLQSERMAQDIIAGSLDGFIQISDTGEVLEWNPQAEVIFGWSREEALGKRLKELFLLPDYRLHSEEMIIRLQNADQEAGVGERFEYEAVRRDGRRIKVETALTALRRGDGHVFNGFVRDLTEKIAAEEQLKQAQKMESVGQLTGGVAHDFNNMLTVITGTIDILADAVADKPQLAAIAKLISEAADRGAELTGHLLAFARKQPLQPRETDVNSLMLETERLLRPALGEHIEVEAILRRELWSALVDPNQLSSALLNLAINARDAMPDGGKLMVETSNVVLDEDYARANADVRPGDYVLVAVSDTGSGIPEAMRARNLRAVLHHKGSRPRNRPWPEHGLWFRQAVRRTRQGLQRGRTRHDIQDLSAAGRRGGRTNRKRVGQLPDRRRQ